MTEIVRAMQIANTLHRTYGHNRGELVGVSLRNLESMLRKHEYDRNAAEEEAAKK